jgi:hypothetical protein
VHANQIIVQCFCITMEHFLSTIELWWICNSDHNQPKWAHFKFESESWNNSNSVVNWKKMKWQKVFQILFPTSTNCPGFLFHFYLFFSRWKSDLGFIWNWKKTYHRWGPPVIRCVTAWRAPIGRTGWHPPVTEWPYKTSVNWLHLDNTACLCWVELNDVDWLETNSPSPST